MDRQQERPPPGRGTRAEASRAGLRELIALLAAPEGAICTVATVALLLTRIDLGAAGDPVWYARWLWMWWPSEAVSSFRLHVWLLWSVFCLLVVPLPIVGLSRLRARDWGVQVGEWRFWLPVVLAAYLVMAAVILLFALQRPEFRTYYPMFRRYLPDYQPALDGWGFFAAYEGLYGLYFLAWEFFFRGFLLFGLARRWGAGAIAVQMMPFTLMHLGKPAAEFFGALPAGWFLGWLAYRSRSFLPCFLLHGAVAFTMDLAALLQGG